MDISKKRWLILLASCFVTLCVGSLYAWSVFSIPMAEYLCQITGKKSINLSVIFTIANAVGPITMIFGGFINDRLGPKWVLFFGGILFGAGMIGSGYANSVSMLIVTYGLGVGLSVGLVYGTTVANTVKFFPDKRGLAGGLITACYGGSSIIIPPIATALVTNYHVTTAFRVIGIVMMFIICASAFVIEACPLEVQHKDNPLAGKKKNKESAGGKEYTYKQMIRESSFYLMLLTLTCGAFAGLMVISQASPIAQQMMGFTRGQAATVVSILALFNMMGRLVSGTMSDKFGATGTLKVIFIGSLIASLLLYFCNKENLVFFYIGLTMIGFCFGGTMGTFPGFTAALFGSRNNSVNYGIMFIGFAFAGLAGPMIMNKINTITGRYQPAFLVSALFAVAGMILIIIFEKLILLNKRRVE